MEEERRRRARISRETSVLEKWKAPRGSEANASEGAQGMKISIVSGLAGACRIATGAKEGWNKVVYRHRSIFLRWFASLHIRRLGTGNISSNHPPSLSVCFPPPSSNHPPSQLFSVLLFVQRIPDHQQLVGTRPVQYDVSKNVLRAYLSVLLVGEKENNAFQRRNSHVRMLVSLARRLDCRCFSINLTFRVFRSPPPPPSPFAPVEDRAVKMANELYVTEK